MTALDERTATGPTARSTARTARGPVLVAGLLVLAGVLVALLSAGSGGALDPSSYAPEGSRAVAELLRDRGVQVDRAETVEEVEAADGEGVTVVLPVPQALTDAELGRLAQLSARRVVVGADDRELEALAVGATAAAAVPVEGRRPACDLPAATAAGDASTGGLTYRATGATASVGCYAASGRATVLDLPDVRTVLLGTGAPLTNDELDERGNAALALGLLGREERVVWLLPRPGRALPEDEQRSLSDLLPDAVVLGALQLLVAAVVLALWRARRLGRVVEEPLPVVVRAAEAVEGRSRLYRAARARPSAAEALRSGARARLGARLGLPGDADRGALVQDVARTLRRDPAGVDALLYGPVPDDDAALVRLAEELRALETALTREVAGP